MVPLAPPDPLVDAPVRPPSRRSRWWTVPMAALGLAALALVLVAAIAPADWRADNATGDPAAFALVPSSAEPVAPLMEFSEVGRYRAERQIMFVTVRLPEIRLLDWWVSQGLQEVGYLSYEDKYGPRTPGQQQQVNLQLMRTAKETAEYVALDYLGYPVELLPGDVIIDELLCFEYADDGSCARSAPSDELLDPGDRLLVVDGVEIEIVDDLLPILARHEPGDRIAIEFERPGEGRLEGEIELTSAPDEPDRTLIGFIPFDTARAVLPFEIDIDTASIGGPSAGLAFTLSLIDELTPGELTGTARVAVTGTIRIDGSVGPIGGLAAKASAARQAGATVFLAPVEQGEDDLARAREVAGDEMEVIAVATLQEAIAALAEYGGNGLELADSIDA